MNISLQDNPILRRWVCGMLVAAGLFVLYFFRMGSYPLVDPDEPVYGQVAKEMAAGAGWLTPHYGGEMWFDKPPLFYWISGVSVAALGNLPQPLLRKEGSTVDLPQPLLRKEGSTRDFPPYEGGTEGGSELACRLPSAILAVALVFLVYGLASYDFGKRAGVFAALAIATCMQTIVLARASVTDMTFVFCLTASLYAYRRWFDATGRGRFGWAALCGAMTGLAMLAKGPAGPVLLAVTIAIHLAWTKRLRRLVTIDALLAVVAALAVGLPWYVAMYMLHREQFVEGFLVANNLTRFLKAEHAEQTGGWYSYLINIPILLMFFLPWSMFLLGAFRRNWKANDGARLAFVWFAVVFVFFSLSKTILVTYIFPCYIAAAIFIGAIWDLAASNDFSAARSVRRGLWAFLVFAALIAVVMFLSARNKYPEAQTAAAVLGAILVVTAIMAVILSKAKNPSHDTEIPRAARNDVDPAYDYTRAAWAIGAGMVVFAAWLMVGIMPVVSNRVSTKDLVSRLSSISGAKLVEYHVEKPSIVFYTGVRPERTEDPARLQQLVRSGEKLIVFCRDSRAQSVEDMGTTRVAESGGLVALVGRKGKTDSDQEP